MKSFLSAAEIAGLKLPGVPSSPRGVLFAAERGGWTSRPRSGRGGGVEYAVESLPEEARIAYVGQNIEAVEIPVAVAREAAAEPEAAKLSGTAAQARDARLAIMKLAETFAAQSKVGIKKAELHFSDLYNGGKIEIAPWIRAEVKALTPRTLRRWRALDRSGQKSKLGVDKAAARRGTGLLDRANGGEVRTFVLALIAKQPQLTAHHIHALLRDSFPSVIVGDRVVALPPIRTLQHALKAWRETFRVELESVRNPDGFKSTMRFAARNLNPASRLNEVWQIDASPADTFTTDGRCNIYVCVDIFSRRMVALVTRTARADGVGLLIRKAILAWGVPERIKTDNGSDFIAHRTQRLFAALGIAHETSAPFSPEQKGHVERAIGTLQRGLMRTLPGFVGHSVADRKVIENRKAFSARLGEAPEDTFQIQLSATDLQKRADEWCADVYGRAPHSGLKGQSPFAVAAMARTKVRRIEDVRSLDMLLAPVADNGGMRVVTKTGLRVNNTHYIGGFLNVGDTVMVRMDDTDMGRAYVFATDGETYLGEAIAPELMGIDPAEAIARARSEQKRFIAERMEPVKRAARKIKAVDFAAAIHRQALVNSGTLIEFPKQHADHETPALAAARAATSEPVVSHSEDIAALAAKMRAEDAAPAPNVKPLRTAETSHQRWNRARGIEERIARKEFVETDELMWLGGYREGAEYKGFAMTYGDADSNVSTQGT